MLFFEALKYHQWRLNFTAMEKARKAAYPSKADIELRSCRSSRGNNNDDAGPLSLIILRSINHHAYPQFILTPYT
jgi:hypothetical protein